MIQATFQEVGDGRNYGGDSGVRWQVVGDDQAVKCQTPEPESPESTDNGS